MNLIEVDNCETCARAITAHNSRKVASFYLCTGCYEVMKSIEGKPRSELKQIIKESEKEIVKDLKTKGVRRPKKWLKDEKKRIQSKGEKTNG